MSNSSTLAKPAREVVKVSVADGLRGFGATVAAEEPLTSTSTCVVPWRIPPVIRFASIVTSTGLWPLGRPAQGPEAGFQETNPDLLDPIAVLVAFNEGFRPTGRDLHPGVFQDEGALSMIHQTFQGTRLASVEAIEGMGLAFEGVAATEAGARGKRARKQPSLGRFGRPRKTTRSL